MPHLKVQKFGDSLGLILPSEVLTRLNCREGETIVLEEDRAGTYNLKHSDPDFDKIMTAADEIMDRYDDALRELAK
jgi:putative addiction module antidote